MLLWIKKNDKFYKFVKKIFKEKAELTNETNFDNLIYYYKNMSKKRFNDLDNVIKLFEKIEDGDMKLEELKSKQNVFKSNLNEIKKEGLKQKSKKVQQKI